MEHLSNSDFRAHLGHALDRVHHTRQRLVVTKHGRPLVGVVPAEDLELLARLEDELEDRWIRSRVRKALAEGGKSIPAEKVWSELGL